MKKTTKVATVVGFALVGAMAGKKLLKKKKQKTESPTPTEQRPDPNPETDLFI